MIKIVIDNGHGENTPGKCSPDGRLREYAYTREVAGRIVGELQSRGCDARLLTPETKDVGLAERVRRVNELCGRHGASNVIVVSVHCNAAPPNDGKWHGARGWCAFTTKGKTKADALADCLYAAADKVLEDYKRTFKGGGKQRPIRTDTTDGDADWEENFYILAKTKCPAVLTENLFQDNEDDVAFLLSEEGKSAIVSLHVEGIINYISKR